MPDVCCAHCGHVGGGATPEPDAGPRVAWCWKGWVGKASCVVSAGRGRRRRGVSGKPVLRTEVGRRCGGGARGAGGTRGRFRKGWGGLGESRPAPGDEKKTWASNRCPENGRLEGSESENLVSGVGCPFSELRFDDRHSGLEWPSWGLFFCLLPGVVGGLGGQRPAVHRCNGRAGSTRALRIEYAFLLVRVAQGL